MSEDSEITLTYLLWPEDPECMSSIEIKSSQSVINLRVKIKQSLPPRYKDVHESDLVLWKFTKPIPGLPKLSETLNTLRSDGLDRSTSVVERLAYPCNKISRYFEAAMLGQESLHILVEIQPRDEGRKQFVKHFLWDNAPSSSAIATTFSKDQQKESQKIIWSRPPAADATIPVTLYNSILRKFVDDCANHEPIYEDNKLALELAVGMSQFFDKKEHRAQTLQRILIENGISVIEPSRGVLRPDWAIECGKELISIIDVKSEIGSKGGEPYALTVLYYTHFGRETAAQHSTFNFPCLIVTVFGPQISFSGAVWRAHPHFQVLTPTMPLFYHQTDTNMRESLARYLGAFRKAIKSLEGCYKQLKTPELLKDLDPEYPDLRVYRSLDTPSEAQVKFKYVDSIDDKKSLFIGKTVKDGDRICIKFIRRYSRAVHEECAKMGIAPKLRGFEVIGAGWTMVIMDALDKEYKPFDKMDAVGATDTYKLIKERLVDLHQANFVHGDVRDVNIMIRKDGEPGIMLVDFDWSGVIGEVRYPMNVNKTQLWRPERVSDGELIKSDDDIDMLEHIFQ
ncbi:hypothetical protein V8E53_008594 [Lactarius tabidus]